jgi:hypothetical protein
MKVSAASPRSARPLKGTAELGGRTVGNIPGCDCEIVRWDGGLLQPLLSGRHLVVERCCQFRGGALRSCGSERQLRCPWSSRGVRPVPATCVA